eukprot:TRINITY_DN8520_c0_g8_i1.p1 TRINITY_DN8520_c0_g8~~TRINITY_DN8520_c0_g8_i1.p1  ORF type:complete len:109 (+),score=8.50 TRINITY_DN8520_c0_g8_i1:204-530(+)
MEANVLQILGFVFRSRYYMREPRDLKGFLNGRLWCSPIITEIPNKLSKSLFVCSSKITDRLRSLRSYLGTILRGEEGGFGRLLEISTLKSRDLLGELCVDAIRERFLG